MSNKKRTKNTKLAIIFFSSVPWSLDVITLAKCVTHTQTNTHTNKQIYTQRHTHKCKQAILKLNTWFLAHMIRVKHFYVDNLINSLILVIYN